MNWRGTHVLIIGAARQGLALARFLASHGAQVTLNDQRSAETLQSAIAELDGLPIRWALGGHSLDLLEGVQLVCPSGGVPLELPLIQQAVTSGIPLSNDSQIFMQHVPCPVIGITGSAGKTTTTTLVGRIAQQASQMAGSARHFYPARVWLGGNIGNPLIAQVDQMTSSDLAVVELSSFQLDQMTLTPHIATVLNITPNHLDRHGDMAAYTAAKARILTQPVPALSDSSLAPAAVLNLDDPGSWALRNLLRPDQRLWTFGRQRNEAGGPGTFYQPSAEADIWLGDGPAERPLLSQSDIRLRGAHNLQNILAAAALACAANLPLDAVRSGVTGFSGVPHRLEFVRTWHGAEWYNDSIATAPERSMAAIRSFTEPESSAPIILLAGGRDKKLPWGDFAALSHQRVAHLVLFGEAAQLIAQAVSTAAVANAQPLSAGAALDLHICANLEQAVQTAANLVDHYYSAGPAESPTAIVLLSPGGTSFDEFRDFEARGEAYRTWVRTLS